MNSPLPTPSPMATDTLRRPRLRRFSGNEAQARTLIAQRAQDCEIRLADLDWLLSLAPIPEPPPADANHWRLDAQWGGARLHVSLPHDAGHAWISARFPDLDLPALPPDFVAATLEEALGDALTALNSLGRGPARIDQLETGGEAADRFPPTSLAHSFALTLQRTDQVIHATLHADSLGLMLIAGLFSSFPPAPNALDDDALPIALRAEIGRSTLSAAMLRALSLRDVILIEQHSVTQSGELWLGRGAFGIRVRHDDTHLIVTEALSTIGTLMTPTESPSTAGSAPVALDEIPVQLAFDLGELEFTLGQLKALQPGQVLDLARPLGSALNIRANGALIGYGELVEVDGRLGVAIAALAEKA